MPEGGGGLKRDASRALKSNAWRQPDRLFDYAECGIASPAKGDLRARHRNPL